MGKDVLPPSGPILDALIERLPDAFVATDADGLIVRWNAAATTLFGYSLEEALGRQGSELLDPHGSEKADAVRAGRAELPTEVVAFDARHRDGHLVPVELTFAPVEPGSTWRYASIIRDVRDRKHAALLLGSATVLFDAAFESSAIGMALVATDMTIERTNRAMQALLGRTARDLVGASLLALTDPHDAARRQTLHTGVRFETHTLRPDGETAWIDLTVSPIVIDRGRPERFVVQAMDITARHIAERELDRERDRLAEAQALAHVGHWELNDGVLVWSAEMARIFGRDVDGRTLGRVDWDGVVHPDDLDVLQASLPKINEHHSSEVTYRIIRPDGEVRWVTSQRRSAQGGRLLGTVQDITEQREAEVRLRQAERLLEQTIDQAPVGMALTGLDGRFIRVNAVLCEMVGRTSEELLRSGFADITHPDDVGASEATSEAMARGEIDECTLEKRYLNARGETVWVLLSISVMRDEQGEPLSFIASMQDITDRQAAATALRASEQAAQDASRMKSQFLANMSHEIRTPMNGVLGMIDALMHSPLNAEQRDHARIARRSAESLLTIIDDVLDFSKVEAGRLELEATEMDLLELMEDTRDLLWHRARRRDLTLISNFDPGVPRHVIGDAGRVRQILINLLSNAIKFSEGGTILLTVTLDGPGRVRFAVNDPGIGIDEETLRRLFQPFTQADASTTRRFGGTGLGLAISRQLAELMDGEIGAESTPGQGSTFWFTAALPEVPEGPVDEQALAGVQVLVCSEDPVPRGALEALVLRWGASVTATSVEDLPRDQVLAMATGRAPAVVLLSDPDGSALAAGLVEQLRARAATDLPVVLLDRDGVFDVVPEGVLVLVPPFRRTSICEALEAAIGRTPASATAAAPSEAGGSWAPEPGEDSELGRGRRVLVAEDNEVNQQVALLSLRRRGFEVDVASDGAEAVEAVEAGRYDLILMDCMMPRMDGFAATAAIRRHQDGTEPTPIIAMTASSMAEDRERCLAAGMDDFVPKPVRAEELDAVLRRWLRAS